MNSAAYGNAARVLIAAARRAHERGDTAERDRLLDDADQQLTLAINAIPLELPQWR